jgi:hypothetical protein
MRHLCPYSLHPAPVRAKDRGHELPRLTIASAAWRSRRYLRAGVPSSPSLLIALEVALALSSLRNPASLESQGSTSCLARSPGQRSTGPLSTTPARPAAATLTHPCVASCLPRILVRPCTSPEGEGSEPKRACARASLSDPCPQRCPWSWGACRSRTRTAPRTTRAHVHAHPGNVDKRRRRQCPARL